LVKNESGIQHFVFTTKYPMGEKIIADQLEEFTQEFFNQSVPVAEMKMICHLLRDRGVVTLKFGKLRLTKIEDDPPRLEDIDIDVSGIINSSGSKGIKRKTSDDGDSRSGSNSGNKSGSNSGNKSSRSGNKSSSNSGNRSGNKSSRSGNSSSGKSNSGNKSSSSGKSSSGKSSSGKSRSGKSRSDGGEPW
jgi:hypothetical protein